MKLSERICGLSPARDSAQESPLGLAERSFPAGVLDAKRVFDLFHVPRHRVLSYRVELGTASQRARTALTTATVVR